MGTDFIIPSETRLPTEDNPSPEAIGHIILAQSEGKNVTR